MKKLPGILEVFSLPQKNAPRGETERVEDRDGTLEGGEASPRREERPAQFRNLERFVEGRDRMPPEMLQQLFVRASGRDEEELPLPALEFALDRGVEHGAVRPRHVPVRHHEPDPLILEELVGAVISVLGQDDREHRRQRPFECSADEVIILRD